MDKHSVLLPFPSGLRLGRLIRRVKRFSVEFAAEDSNNGESLWAHTNNSGAMQGLCEPGLTLALSPAPKPGRKLPYTLELVKLPHTWVGVNTLTPNRLLKAAFLAGLLPWAAGYTQIKPEAVRGTSRIDACLSGPGLPPLWVECKNVTLVDERARDQQGRGLAAFPDAVSERAQKHLREMTDIVKNGERAAFFYCVQRADTAWFAPADYIDRTYAALFRQSLAAGVEVYPYRCAISLECQNAELTGGIGLGDLLPLWPGETS